MPVEIPPTPPHRQRQIRILESGSWSREVIVFGTVLIGETVAYSDVGECPCVRFVAETTGGVAFCRTVVDDPAARVGVV